MTSVVRLGDLFRVGSSKRVLKSQWQSDGVPFYRGREVTRLAADGFVENEIFISDSLYEELSDQYGVPRADDIMVTAIGTIGNSYVVRRGDRFYFKDASVLWLKKTADSSSKFINYWLKSDQFFDQLDRGNGATVDTLTIQKLQSLGIVLPPLATQRRIVAILDEAFEGIATARANAEKNLLNAREVFDGCLEELFTRQHGATVEYVLGEVCDIRSKLVDPREDEYLDLPHVGAGNIESRTGDVIDVRTAREEQLISGKFLFDDSTVLYSKIRPYLMKVVCPDFSGLCSADIYPLAPRPDKINRDYLFYLLLTPAFTDYAIKGSARAGMPKVNRDHLFAYRCVLPAVHEQERSAELLDALFDETQRLAVIHVRKLAALDELKKSLLHQAFSGAL